MDKVASRSRLGEIEWIRAISCILVIIIHVTAEYWTSFIQGSLQYKLIILLNSIAQFAVPSFIFISGFVLYYVYHNREYKSLDFYKKRMSKVILPYLIWSGVYICFRYFNNNGPIGLIGIGKDLLIGRASGHLYYMILIIQFYLAFPFILKFYKKINNRILFMTIFLVLNIIISEFINIPFKDRFFMNYLIYFGLGIILADLKIQEFNFSKILKVGIMALYLTFTIYFLKDRYNATAGLPLISNGLYRYAWRIFSVISIMNIYISANILNDIKNNWVNNRLIRSLSKHSFTIYLSHMLFIRMLRNLKSFNNLETYSLSLAFFVQLIVIISVSWLTSILIGEIKSLLKKNKTIEKIK